MQLMETSNTRKPRILIVDDERSIREALRRWFRIHGFETEEAVDGIEAVEKCAANQYDVITMDLEMPRMGGIEAIEIIRETRPEAPILVLTGYSRVPSSPALKGVAKILAKPIRLTELEREVRKLVQVGE